MTALYIILAQLHANEATFAVFNIKEQIVAFFVIAYSRKQNIKCLILIYVNCNVSYKQYIHVYRCSH